MRYQEHESGLRGGYMHDPLAVAAALLPGLVPTARRSAVTVDTRGSERGRTLLSKDAGAPIDVAGPPDCERFLGMLEERVIRPLFGPDPR